MEHHSNQTSWLETIADVEIIDYTTEGLVNLAHLEKLLTRYSGRKKKYASVTASSNVTGVKAPIHEIAAIMHHNGGYCFVDYAAAAPYLPIDMHPAKREERL